MRAVRLAPADLARLKANLGAAGAILPKGTRRPRLAKGLPADYGAVLDIHCTARGIPQGQPEYLFHPVRKWRFDRAWPELRLAVEIEGGLYTAGRHTRGKGYEDDLVKYAEALLLGWRVLRVSTGQVKTGLAADWLARAVAIAAPPV